MLDSFSLISHSSSWSSATCFNAIVCYDLSKGHDIAMSEIVTSSSSAPQIPNEIHMLPIVGNFRNGLTSKSLQQIDGFLQDLWTSILDWFQTWSAQS